MKRVYSAISNVRLLDPIEQHTGDLYLCRYEVLHQVVSEFTTIRDGSNVMCTVVPSTSVCVMQGTPLCQYALDKYRTTILAYQMARGHDL